MEEQSGMLKIQSANGSDIEINKKKRHKGLKRYEEPITHRDNMTFFEWLIGRCLHSQLELSGEEVNSWGELYDDSQAQFDASNHTHMMMLAELWNIMTGLELDRENFKSEEWIKYGFQNKNPSTDFRGGGVLSLTQMIIFARNNRDIVVKDMINPQNDFFFALSAINVTFFLKQTLHLSPHLHPRKDKHIFCDRHSLKVFCTMLNKDEDAFHKLHDIILKDVFNTWTQMKKQYPQTTLLDFPKVEGLYKQKFRSALARSENNNITQFINTYN